MRDLLLGIVLTFNVVYIGAQVLVPPVDAVDEIRVGTKVGCWRVETVDSGQLVTCECSK